MRLKIKHVDATGVLYSYISGEDGNGRQYEVSIKVNREKLIAYIIPVYMQQDDLELLTEACKAIFDELIKS